MIVHDSWWSNEIRACFNYHQLSSTIIHYHALFDRGFTDNLIQYTTKGYVYIGRVPIRTVGAYKNALPCCFGLEYLMWCSLMCRLGTGGRNIEVKGVGSLQGVAEERTGSGIP